MRMILSYCTIDPAARANAVTMSPPPNAVLRRMRIEMGTTLVVEARGESESQVGSAVAAAFAAAENVAACLHPQAPGSDLRRLRDARPGTAVPIAAPTFAVLSFAQRLNRMSEGIFDPCLPTRPGRVVDLELVEGEAFGRRHASHLALQPPAGYSSRVPCLPPGRMRRSQQRV